MPRTRAQGALVHGGDMDRSLETGPERLAFEPDCLPSRQRSREPLRRATPEANDGGRRGSAQTFR